MTSLLLLHVHALGASLRWSTTYPDGTSLAVESVAPSIVRVTTTPWGAPRDLSPVSLIVPQDASAAPPLTVAKSARGWRLTAGNAVVDVDGTAPLANISRGETLLSAELAAPLLVTDPKGCGTAGEGRMAGGRWPDCPTCCLRARRSVQAGEEIFGGGVQLSSGPRMRGRKLFLKTNALAESFDGLSHVVAPFFMSSLSFGVFANTHRYSFWDIGTKLPPPSRNAICDEKWADPATGRDVSDLNLTCAKRGATITDITFAQYGLPSGACGWWTASDVCGVDVRAQLRAACVGKPSCAVHVSNEWAGVDPCPGNAERRVAAQAQCSGGALRAEASRRRARVHRDGALGAGPAPAPASSAYASEMAIHVADPVVDLYFFVGPTHHDVLAAFTQVS